MAETKTLAAKPTNYLGANKLDRTHVFIDAMNLMGMMRQVDKRLDFTKFLDFLGEQTRLIRCSYYVMLRESISTDALKTIDMMEYAGFDVNRKWIEEMQDSGGHFQSRSTVVPEMTVGIIDAVDNGADHVFILTGDAEMSAAVIAAKQRESRVTLLGVEGTVSDVLKRECDEFVDIVADLPSRLYIR